MPEVRIEIKNLPQIRAAFRKAPKIMGDEFAKALKGSIIRVSDRTQLNVSGRFVNVRSGRLKGSIPLGISFQGDGVGQKAILDVDPSRKGSSVANYAVFLHEGTRFIRARPFLKVAADESTGDIDKLFTTHTQKALDRIAGMT